MSRAKKYIIENLYKNMKFWRSAMPLAYAEDLPRLCLWHTPKICRGYAFGIRRGGAWRRTGAMENPEYP